VAKADSLGRNAPWVPREKWYGSDAQEWFIERARQLDVAQRPPEPLLLGRHLLALGVEPGPRVGEITRAVYEMQLDGRVRTVEEAIAEAEKLVSHG
jgi:tRNA nucleotidyltransferase (CCA-adding enzyme)